jgi:tetratricopeptide (TPR) repeat protein
MLLEMNRPAEALQAFETSEKHDPNRFRGLYGAGKAAALMGDQAKARSYYGKLLVLVQKADSERPELKEAKAFLAKK